MAVSTPPDLWKAAIDSVDLQVKDRLAPTKTLVRDIVYEVLKEAKARHNDSVKQRLRLPNGIIVRDVMEKIMHWVNCFKEVGDNAVQFDPGHAALPWAAVRFILQALVNYGDAEREILEEIELIARLLAIFRGIEKSYLGPDAMAELQDALVRAYIAILETLANAVKLLGESKKARLLKAPFRVPDQKNINRLLAQEREVFSFTRLVDGDRVSQVMRKLERLTERSTITDIAVENDKHRAVLAWLSKTNYRDHHRDLSGMRLTGTADWLLQHAEYMSWQQQSTCSTLIVHGIPGCGKTILCSAVIDELMQSASSARVRAPVAYFYCSAVASEPDRRDLTKILRSLLRQFAIGSSQSQRIHSAVLAAYDARLEEARKDGFDICPLDAAECETMILEILEDNPATLVIDAIDEIDNPQGLLHSLQTICNKSKNILKVLISSRDNPLILSTPLATHHIRVTTKDNRSDIHKFITQRVDQLIERRKMPRGMRDETILGLSTRAGGMFQWAKLQLAQMEISQDPLVEKDFREKLSEMATSTLGELYGSIFGAIMQYKETARQMATHTFSWLLFACEPLNVNMLLAATANGAGWETPTPEGFLEICRGFVYVDTQSNLVRLVHESVREFLLSQPLLQPHLGQTLISLSCLQILENPPHEDVKQLKPADEPYDYATLYCGQHFSQAGSGSVSDTLSQKVETFLFDGEDVSIYADIWLTTVKTICDDLPHDHSQKVPMGVVVSESCSPIFPISAFGLLFLLEAHHWPPGFDWNQRNSQNHTALYLAANFGHDAVVSFLLDRNADPNVKCGIFGTALQCAAYRGHIHVVEVLVDRGADLKLPGKFESVLHAACSGGHEEVALKLLESRLTFTTQSEYDIAAAEVAKAGFARALDKLQAHPLSNTLTSDKIHQQARAAIISGRLAVLKRLISRSTFDLVIVKGSLALSAVHGHEEIAEFLLANGVDIDEHGHLGTPLRCASVCGHNNICRLLLDHGADVDTNARFGTALHAAAMRGHLHTAKFLLDKGADVNAKGGHYGTPIQAAAYHGHVELVNLLLGAKADMRIPGLFRDAFRAAIEGGRENVVRIFTDAGLHGLAGNTKGYQYAPLLAGYCEPVLPPRNILRDSSPSRRAAQPDAGMKHYDSFSDSDDGRDEAEGNTKVELDPFDPAHAPCPHKLRRGPHRSRPQHPKQGMLETAAGLGHLSIVRALLSEGSDFGHGKIALVAACRHGQSNVVRGLIGSLSLNSDGMRDAFAAASIRCDDETTQILMSALEKLEGQEIARFLRSLLLSCVPDNPFLFDHTLRRVMADASEHFVETTLVSCLCDVASAGWSESLQIMLDRLHSPTTKTVVLAFEAAFDAGHAATVSMLQKLLTEENMTAQQYNGFARLAIQAGHTEVFECLLPRTGFSGDKQSFENMIYCAAGSGLLEILTTLTSQDWKRFYDKELLTKALLIAARHGHYDTSSYLVSKGAEVCLDVIEPRDRDVLVSKTSVYRYLYVPNESSSIVHSRRPHKRNSRRPRRFLGPSGNANKRGIDTAPEKRCNSIEACLAGYGRFSVYDGSRHDCNPSWQLADEPLHARTLFMLFDHCTDFRGQQWANVICKASAICTPRMLDLMLAKGADPHASNDTTSALVCAAGRSTSTFAAVQALVSAASDTSFGEAELWRALDTSISLFREVDDQTTWYYGGHAGTLFSMYETIEEIFVSGPGAAVNYLLGRLPQEAPRGDRYSLCLQMAAAAGDYKVVRLLLERGVDCNTVIGYYGTALKAASRFGNLAIVALLLDFGADHTIADGEASYTALQAAVMAQSLSCVRALLDHGAIIDMSTSTRDRLPSSFSRTTTLSLAVDARITSVSVLLIEAGAQTEEVRDYEQPLLIKACSWGETSVVRSLLKSGADVRVLGAKDRYSKEVPKRFGSALHAAIEFGHVHLIELLVTHGLYVTADCGTAGTPLEYALSKADIFVVAALLKLCPLDSGKPFVEAAQKAILLSRLDLVRLVCEHARGILTAHDVLLMCKTSTFATQCSIVWYLLERLRQLNGSARQFAEAVRHFMQHAQTATALQIFTHAEKFVLSREIWNVLEQACLRSSRQFVILLIETLQERPDFDLELEIASTDVAGMLPEHVETLLSYVPCTHAMFIEACVRGNEQVVRIGLRQGLASDDDDWTQRPALHFAAAHGRTVIVKLLLEERPWSHGRHAEYGTPIEAVLMSCASDSWLIRRSLSEKESRYLEDLTRRDETDYVYSQLFSRDPRRDAACKEVMGLLLEHESHRSPSEGASGSTFLELSLAACLGWRDVLRQLLMRGTPVSSCRNVLISPLSAAINSDGDDSLGMVKEILDFDKSLSGVSFYDPEGHALHHACQCADLPIVEVLLSRGYRFAYKNGEGQSALTVCLGKVAESFYLPGDTHLAIAHTLLERDDVSSVSAEDIVAACGIALGGEQNALFQKLFARWEPSYIPEEGIIRLLGAEEPIYDIPDEDTLRQRVFDERRIEKLTANLFAGVGRADVLTKLLDYDQSFVVGTDIIDIIGTRSRHLGHQTALDCVAKLLDRCPNLVPVESNVVRVLQVGDCDDASHILKMLFARNLALVVTELMLKSCRNSVNLQLLLGRGKTEDHGLMLSLMDALVEESEDWGTWNKSEGSARLAVLLDQVPCAKVPRKVIDHIMESNDIGNIGRILDRDPDTSLTGDVLSAIIKAPKTVALHLDVVDFLRKYHDRYSMSDVHLAVGSIHMYSTDDELRAKKMYFELPG